MSGNSDSFGSDSRRLCGGPGLGSWGWDVVSCLAPDELGSSAFWVPFFCSCAETCGMDRREWKPWVIKKAATNGMHLFILSLTVAALAVSWTHLATGYARRMNSGGAVRASIQPVGDGFSAMLGSRARYDSLGSHGLQASVATFTQ